MAAEIVVGVAVLCGAVTQRLTGLGFALVSIPFLVLAIGPHDGVLLANMLSLVVSCAVALLTWREVRLLRTTTLAAGAMVGLPLGVVVANAAQPAHLMIGVSLAAILSLTTTWRRTPSSVRRSARHAPDQIRSRLSAGAISGFMNATAGLGGPAMVVHARAVAWPHRSFVASMQVYFIIINSMSVMLKGGPAVSPGILGAALGCLLIGVVLGHAIREIVPLEIASRWTVVVATAGSVVVGLRGMAEIF